MPGSSRLPVSLPKPIANSARGHLLVLNLDLLRNILLIWFIARITRLTYYQLKGRGPIGSLIQAYRITRKAAYHYFQSLPVVRSQLRTEVENGLLKIEQSMVPSGPGVERYTKLPAEGWSKERIMEEMERLAGMKHERWEDGRVSGAVYHGGKELRDLQTEAFGLFTVANPIHPEAFPGVRKMEAEVVAMVLNLFNAPADAAGVTTSGGTESILMACLAARNKAYHERGITSPEMIVPDTGHAAFYKAGEYFKIKVHRVRCPAPTYKADIDAISWLINPNTILLVGSAPNYPHGIIDDIPALSRLAVKKKIPLHVDCCLGSFVIACLEKAGFESEMFDFRLKGVTSISCDTHKYGFAPKGSSTVLYRSKDMRAYQYFIYADWPGGIYGSPSMAGSRPGALIAGCWATMMRVGEAGYVDATHKIVTAARKIEVAIREDPELSADLDVMGQPKVTVVAFTPSPSSELNIYRLADEMKERGWHLNALQDPPGLHVAVTIPIVSSADDLLSDLKETLRKMREDDAKDQAEGKLENKKKKMGDTAVVYGVAGSFPDKGIVKELTKGFLDTMYKA